MSVPACRRQPVSVFRKVSLTQMENFSWDWFVDEVVTNCPVLYQLLMTVVFYTDRRNTHKKGSAHNPSVCMAVAVLLKEHNREMIGVQLYLSLVLYNSCVPK